MIESAAVGVEGMKQEPLSFLSFLYFPELYKLFSMGTRITNEKSLEAHWSPVILTDCSVMTQPTHALHFSLFNLLTFNLMKFSYGQTSQDFSSFVHFNTFKSGTYNQIDKL